MKLCEILHLDSSFFKNTKVHFAYPCGPELKDKPIYQFTSGGFKEWQECQNARNFGRKYILSLIKIGKGEWLFAGIYESLGCVPLEDVNLGKFKYTTRLTDKGEDLIGRAVIRHLLKGKMAIRNGENCNDGLDICEIKRDKVTLEPFTSFESTSIPFDFLQVIVKQQEPSWKSALSSVKGVYLIADKSNGKLYVGAAYGKENFWQRWSVYADNGHGGNVKLRKIIEEKGLDYAKKNFVFSILETCKNKVARTDIIERETSYWKKVLLTEKFGYN